MLGRLVAQPNGFYSVPRPRITITVTINPIITRVSFPLGAGTNRHAGAFNLFENAEHDCLDQCPLYVGGAFFAPEVVRILLGEKWMESADLLRLLALWGFVRSTWSVGSLFWHGACGSPSQVEFGHAAFGAAAL
jgi:PST family polysaccharide transporter/teichuronic acid exporter/lipopolysaccharide exporter